MRLIYYTLFLVFFITSGVLLFSNLDYQSEFFFFQVFEEDTLALPFLGFTALGIFIGIFFSLSVKSLFKTSKNTQKEAEETSSSNSPLEREGGDGDGE